MILGDFEPKMKWDPDCENERYPSTSANTKKENLSDLVPKYSQKDRRNAAKYAPNLLCVEAKVAIFRLKISEIDRSR